MSKTSVKGADSPANPAENGVPPEPPKKEKPTEKDILESLALEAAEESKVRNYFIISFPENTQFCYSINLCYTL